MEFELLDRPRNDDPGGDQRIFGEKRMAFDWSPVDAQEDPDGQDRALFIPEEED